MSRFVVFTVVIIVLLTCPVQLASADSITLPGARPFSAGQLLERARLLSRRPFQPPLPIPATLANLTYDQHRDIRFRPDKALWRNKKLPFEVQFFHPGWLYNYGVQVNEVVDGQAERIAFTSDDFNYGKNNMEAKISRRLGFAGLRVHYALNRPDYLDEVVAFLGASYFRAVGKDQLYGVTARGLAIVGSRDGMEEFPIFREFWLERPAASATRITLHALLDSPSVTGAYTFTVHPGITTVMDVKATLFARRDIERLGVAPLTSMYFFGKKDPRFDDFRPEVHDSDGLSVYAGNGEWIWRPLVNPPRVRISLYSNENPRGFGLLQKNRNFDDYQDLESRYERRPSLWVEPTGLWGKGSIQLVEIPSDREINDNIVAYWVPDGVFKAGERRDIGYRLHWCLRPPDRPSYAVVLASSSGKADEKGARRFVVDFQKGTLAELSEQSAVEADISVSAGRCRNVVVHKNQVSDGFRVFFDVIPGPVNPVEIRCFLKRGATRLSETWSYQWTP